MTAAPKLRRLTRRSEFLKAGRGVRAGRTSLSMQMSESAGELPGLGLTVTKKVGNAPQRNRIKRRLRAAAHSCADAFEPRHDYVLVARREALGTPFAALIGELHMLLDRVHKSLPPDTRTKAP